YSVTMNAVLGADGRLIAGLSNLDFNFQGLLSGTLTPQLDLGPTVDAAIWKLNNVLGVPPNVTDSIRQAFRGKTGAPTVDLNGTMPGALDAPGSFAFGGTGLSPATSLRSWHGLLDVSPTVLFTVFWPGGSFTVPNSPTLAKYFAIHLTW